jgi:hypothetical protein
MASDGRPKPLSQFWTVRGETSRSCAIAVWHHPVCRRHFRNGFWFVQFKKACRHCAGSTVATVHCRGMTGTV